MNNDKKKIKEYNERFQQFLYILNTLSTLKKGDKLYWDENEVDETQTQLQKLLSCKLHIQQPSFSTSFSRWYYGQTRHITFEYLSILSQHYNKLMDDVIYGIYHSSIRLEFYQLGELIQNINRHLTNSLNNLKETYSDEKEYVIQLESFLCNLNNFDKFISDIMVDTLHTEDIPSSKPSEYLSKSCINTNTE